MNRTLLEAPFPPEQIRQREGKRGQVLDYVEGSSVIQRLNEALEGAWSFEIVEYQVHKDLGEVLVLGKLTVEGVTKSQFGSSQLTKHRETGELLSLGDDLKAAATDALKKASTLLGIGLYLYGDRNQESNAVAYPNQPEGDAAARHSVPVGNRSAHGGRLSAKQLQLLHKLAVERRLSRNELTLYCQEKYGRVPDFLTKAQASKLIDELMAGQVQIPAQAGCSQL